MDAVKSAEKLGVYGVEVDVQTTADGVPILMHDDTVGRTTSGDGKVAEKTWQELKSLGVDRLYEALLALDSEALMLLEIKAPESRSEVNRIVAIAMASGKRVIVESFDRGIVAQAHRMGAETEFIHPRSRILMADTGTRPGRLLSR